MYIHNYFLPLSVIKLSFPGNYLHLIFEGLWSNFVAFAMAINILLNVLCKSKGYSAYQKANTKIALL